MPVDTFVEVVEALNNFISFRTNAALTPKQLPTLGAVAERLQVHLNEALKDDDARAIRAGLYIISRPGLEEDEGELSISAVGPGGKTEDVVTFGCKLKQIEKALAAREVWLLENDSGAESLSELVNRFQKERARHLKAAKKQAKIDAAAIELQAAARKLLALGLGKDGIAKIINDVCQEERK